jgi:hypothetical protein
MRDDDRLIAIPSSNAQSIGLSTKEHGTNSLRLLLSIGGIIAVGVSAVLLLNFRTQSSDSQSWKRIADESNDEPTTLLVSDYDIPAISGRDLDWIKRLLPAEDNQVKDFSFLLHLVRVRGLDYAISRAIEQNPGNLTIRDLIFNDRYALDNFGASPMIPTDTGVRYLMVAPFARSARNSNAAESHRDQLLATMAELDVPLNQPIYIDGVKYSLRDVLRDCLAQFRMDQEELEWSAYALAAYLPPQKSWTNRYNEVYTFDLVAEKLLRKDLAKGSCCGLHIVQTLTLMQQVDESTPIFSHSIRQKVNKQIDRWFDLVLTSQLSDGSWPPAWWKDTGALTSEQSRLPLSSTNDPTSMGHLLATSHIVEWLLVLPTKDYDVPSGVLFASSEWLIDRLRHAKADDINQHFCPYSHSCSALLRLHGP